MYRIRLDPGDDSGAAELVEGVENMQVLYGVDKDGNRAPDEYVDAANVPDWERVTSARISLLVRSADTAMTNSALDDHRVGYVTVSPLEDDRVRQVMSLTVALRNRLP